MILIIDSGSTKADWKIFDENSNFELDFTSIGLNPNFINEQTINSVMTSGNIDYEKYNIQKIFFYGSGCGSKENKELIKNIFLNYFPIAKINVNTDILGAARALFFDKNGIACILGTGSNIALYQDFEIKFTPKSYGYLLSDFGSGTSLGIAFLKAYINNMLSNELVQKFNFKYPRFEDEVVRKIYKEELPNRYIASFSEFIKENIDDEFLNSMVYKSFLNFFEYHKKHVDFNKNNLGFVGSIAFHFSDILLKTASHLNIRNIDIIKNPIDNLIIYHKHF